MDQGHNSNQGDVQGREGAVGQVIAEPMEEINEAAPMEGMTGDATVEEVNGAAVVNVVNGAGVNPAVHLPNDACRKAIARFVILSKLPFSVVESDSFNRLCKHLQPLWIIPSKRTVARDCFKIYRDEKLKLKAYFKSDCSRLALTPEVWTSRQNFSYISVTAHFIDNELKYQKRLLSFSLVPNLTTDTIGRNVEESLRGWGLRNVSAITIDNASSNDVATMVKDILAIPTAISLDSIFSKRVRMLDTCRSSLSPRIAEALICSHNWLKPTEEFEVNEVVVAEVNQGLTIWCWEAVVGGAPPATVPAV